MDPNKVDGVTVTKAGEKVSDDESSLSDEIAMVGVNGKNAEPDIDEREVFAEVLILDSEAFRLLFFSRFLISFFSFIISLTFPFFSSLIFFTVSFKWSVFAFQTYFELIRH